ncbi:hypothetical protein SAMN06296386_103218 [Lachnospiraceae bacterium]|nr:hypothetical protein SAMN06296386_103218 [Lachnospiraceae bacterium]
MKSIFTDTADSIEALTSSGMIAWTDLSPSQTVLYVNNCNDKWNQALIGYLELNVHRVDVIDVCDLGEDSFLCERVDVYDRVIMIGALEICSDPVKILTGVKRCLNDNGHLFLATDNRMGLRYFCGDRDPFTNRNFDGIENYQSVPEEVSIKMKGRCYSDYEVKDFLRVSGFKMRRFSVIPSVQFPQLVYAEDYLPREELSIRYFPVYHSNRSVFIEEQLLYADLIKNGLFHQLANGYFYDCMRDEEDEKFLNVEHVTLAMNRGVVNSGLTIIRNNKTVEKRPALPEGRWKTEALINNADKLQSRGISVLNGININGNYTMPYVEAESVVNYFARLIIINSESFIEAMDKFMDIVLRSAEHVEMPDIHRLKEIIPEKLDVMEIIDSDGKSGVWLSNGYLDLVPLNAFFINNEYVFYDQEFCTGIYPARAIILRVIHIAYADRKWMEEIVPKDFFYQRYGLQECLEGWEKYQSAFTDKLLYWKEREKFWGEHGPEVHKFNEKRDRLNNLNLSYRNVYMEIFGNIEGRRLFIFGAGKYAEHFLKLYGANNKIEGLLDNRVAESSARFMGIPVYSPNILKQYKSDEIKVIICIANYHPVMKQLLEMGIENVSVYNWNLVYLKGKPNMENII